MGRCRHIKANGEPCRAAALAGQDFCLFHDPSRAEEVEEARRLGGLRRRRERTVCAIYDFQGLRSIADIVRVLESVVSDTLSLDNSVERSRALAQLSEIARRCVVYDQEERICALEAALRSRPSREEEIVDLDLDLVDDDPERDRA